MDKGWGAEKVRIFYGDCREKGLLWVLAHWADGTGKDIYPSYQYLSSCTGQSIRTIRRQVRTLVMRGDLVSWCDLKRSRDSNYYMIPICAETVSELEQRTGISRRQLKLPLVHELIRAKPIQNDVDRVEQLAKFGVKKRPTPRATVSVGEGHCDPVTGEADILDKKVSKNFLLEKGNGMNNTQIDRKHDQDAVQAGHRVDHMAIMKEANPEFYAQFEKLRAGKLVDVGVAPTPGTSLRDALGWNEECEALRRGERPDRST